VFQLLLKADTRQKFPNLEARFAKNGRNHALGTTRIGDQIDLQPISSNVARDSDTARELNKGVKKKETQRQREKRMKEDQKNASKKIKTSSSEKPASTTDELVFKFKGLRVEADEDTEKRIEAVFTALKALKLNDKVEMKKHPVCATVEEMLDKLSDCKGGKCKNMFLKYSKKKSRSIENDTGLWLVSCLHDTKIDLKKLSKHLDYPKALRMGRPDVLKKSLGLVKGECSPLALMNDEEKQVQVIFDSKMMKEDMLWFHPLTNQASVGIKPADLMVFVRACGRDVRVLDLESL
jgi:Ala-tRNA(Pro) deacylase